MIYRNFDKGVEALCDEAVYKFFVELFTKGAEALVVRSYQLLLNF